MGSVIECETTMRKFWVRLAFGFLLVSWLSLVVVALMMNSSIQQGFRSYVAERDQALFGTEQIERFESYYAQNGSWSGVEDTLSNQGQGNRQGRGPQIYIADENGLIVAAIDPEIVGQSQEDLTGLRSIVLTVDDHLVGYLGQQTPGAQALASAEERFAAETSSNLLLAAVGAGVLALGAGAMFSWRLVRPLNTLTVAVQDISHANLGQQIDLRASDEINQLADAFNEMSAKLAQAEAMRQRLTADVAHELRTPLTILLGQLEAMLDGIYPMDTEHVAVGYEQTLHLVRLVEDLRTLTTAEAGHLPLHRRDIVAEELVHNAYQRFLPLCLDADVSLILDITLDNGIKVDGDEDRLTQVLDNFLANAMIHTPPQGSITLSLASSDGGLRFCVANTGSFLSAEDIQHVFDRFWRQQSGQRVAGGSGLGLTIARQFVKLHGGSIGAESDTESTRFYFVLPRAGH